MRRAAVTPGFQRAEDDLAAGRLWKARDRVNGLLRNGCADQDVLDLAVAKAVADDSVHQIELGFGSHFNPRHCAGKGVA